MNWREILKNQSTSDQENKENQEYQNQNQSNIPDITYILDKQKLTTETTEHAKYLFFERLGISDDCELALDEALNYINQKLTIN